MSYEDHVTDPGNLRMREVSGEVDDSRPLVAFLYELARDEITTGALEERLDRISTGDGFQFTNGWLARWAQDAADRLAPPDPQPTSTIRDTPRGAGAGPI